MKDERKYFIVRFIYKQREYYSIWFDDERDGFITENERIITFPNKAQLKKHCSKQKLAVEESISEYDLDKLDYWISEVDPTIDAVFILNFWNIFMDVSASVDKPFMGDEEQNGEVYRKLFYGNNLPSINRSGELYIPEWSENEVIQIKCVMENGSELFRENTCV